MLIYFVAFSASIYCQSFGNEVSFLGLLPLYNFFSNNRPAQHPTLSLYESLNPTQFSTTPKISPLVPVYAFLNNYGASQSEPVTRRPTYIIPQPMIPAEETTLEASTEPPTTSTSRPPLPPPPSPPPPPLPPPVTSSMVYNIYNTKTNKSKHPLPLSRPSGSYRPYRPIKHPPTPPPDYRIMTSDNEENDFDEIYMPQDITASKLQSDPQLQTSAYKYSTERDGRIYYQNLS